MAGQRYTSRETWTTNLDFLLACVGFSVGLGNVWRFPYLCYKNGGGAFLIPYFLSVVVGGVPLFFLEVSIGQFMGVAGVNAWKICPFFRGIGISTLTIVFFLNCYYNVILAWAIRYFFASFTSKLPWSECDREDWATANCSTFEEEHAHQFNECRNGSEDGILVNGTCWNATFAKEAGFIIDQTINATSHGHVDPGTEYWERKVLRISDGIDNMGPANWDLVLCLLLAWILVYLVICKGIRSSGKVMYVTATSPYIFMFVLLIRNSMLDGATEGVIFYLKPDFSRMADVQVWVDAGTQIFFSYSISLGGLTALASYNKFNHNVYRDSILFAVVNSLTSLLAGFIIFTILGHMSHVQGKDIKDVAKAGPGLAFIAYAKALTLLPVAPFWSVMFFLMVILMGCDSQFVGVESVITPIVDQFPGFLRKGYRREIFIGVVCSLHFLIGLPMVCPGGMYVFQLIDHFSGSRIILLVGGSMTVAIAWAYGYIFGHAQFFHLPMGLNRTNFTRKAIVPYNTLSGTALIMSVGTQTCVERFYDNLEMMFGWRINSFMKYCWKFGTPLFSLIIFILSVVEYSELTYESSTGKYYYPQWAIGIGWTMAAFAAMWIPIGWIYHVIKYGRDIETMKLCFVPLNLQDHQMRPEDKGEKTLSQIKITSNIPSSSFSQRLYKTFDRTHTTPRDTNLSMIRIDSESTDVDIGPSNSDTVAPSTDL